MGTGPFLCSPVTKTAFYLKFLERVCRLLCRNFKQAALVELRIAPRG